MLNPSGRLYLHISMYTYLCTYTRTCVYTYTIMYSWPCTYTSDDHHKKKPTLNQFIQARCVHMFLPSGNLT